jgi:CARDB protein
VQRDTVTRLWPLMSERDSDIEFDFFEESETGEAAAEERPRRRGTRPPVRPPTGLTPLLRLVGLISFAILIVLLLVLWVNGCREDQRKNSYRNYVEKVSDLATRSDRIGKRLNTLLTTRGTKETAVEQELSGLAIQQQQVSADARNIDPPGHLRTQQAHVLDSFDLRANGLNGMSGAFKKTASSKNANQAGAELAKQMNRLVASDVIWDDLFKEPTKDELKTLGVSGVVVPDSIFVPNADIATSGSMKQVWQRIHGAAAPGGSCSPRGTRIVSVKVLPSGTELSTSSLNTIQQRESLRFAVTVENSGCAQEVRLPVRLTIQQNPRPLRGQKTIDLINPGDQKTVEFSNLGLPPLDQKTSLTVEVEPVPTETKTDNNTASYPVQFAVG